MCADHGSLALGARWIRSRSSDVRFVATGHKGDVDCRRISATEARLKDGR